MRMRDKAGSNAVSGASLKPRRLYMLYKRPGQKNGGNCEGHLAFNFFISKNIELH